MSWLTSQCWYSSAAPPRLVDEPAVDPRLGQRPHDVGRSLCVEALGERPGSDEGDELGHALTSRPLNAVEVGQHLRVRTGRLLHDVVQSGETPVHLGDEGGEQVHLLAWIRTGGDVCCHLPLAHGDGLVISDDRHVDQPFEQASLATEGCIDGGGGHARARWRCRRPSCRRTRARRRVRDRRPSSPPLVAAACIAPAGGVVLTP